MRTAPTAALRAAVIGDAASALEEAGVESALHDAEVLAAHALGVPRSRLNTSPMFDGEQFEMFRTLIGRRASREPLQYIVGTAAFRHIDVQVGTGAFIPRPETELLAGWVIDNVTLLTAPVVVDLCAGPGTIALSIAHEVPHAVVYAVEANSAAAEWARRNIESSGANVQLHVGDVTDTPASLDGTVDAVVANPPYIVRGTIDQPEVKNFEPAMALYADGDGLSGIRTVLTTAARLLSSGGCIAVEHGDDQGAAVTQLMTADGFVDVVDHRDLNGRDRFTTARKR